MLAYFLKSVARKETNISDAADSFVANNAADIPRKLDSSEHGLSSNISWGSLNGSFSPSFDCGQNLNQIENLICGDKNLSELDRELSELYRNLQKQENADQNLKAEQREWLLSQRDACSDKQCVLSAYLQRIKQLSSR